MAGNSSRRRQEEFAKTIRRREAESATCLKGDAQEEFCCSMPNFRIVAEQRKTRRQ
jgi:hypothetical protein